MASTSSTVSSGTVVSFTRPVADTVMASAAAALLSGRSQITNASSSPNAKWKDSIEPPTCLAPSSAAARRADPPSFITPCSPSPEYCTFSRYFGMAVPLSSDRSVPVVATLARPGRRGKGSRPPLPPAAALHCAPVPVVHAVANQKGGVAKTTTVHALGAALAERGRRVLLVDLDPQGCLTFSVGIDPNDLEKSLHDVFVHRTPATEVLLKVGELHLLPATLDLAATD